MSFDLPAGTVLLLDNVSFHHSKVVKEYAISQGLVLLYVPPYSPWFNSVEGVFSIAKMLTRRPNQQALVLQVGKVLRR